VLLHFYELVLNVDAPERIVRIFNRVQLITKRYSFVVCFVSKTMKSFYHKCQPRVMLMISSDVILFLRNFVVFLGKKKVFLQSLT
jgi:hypothetical protein